MLEPHAHSIPVDDVLESFLRDGFAHLGQILSANGVKRLRQTCDAITQGDVQYPNMFFQHDSPTGKYADLSYGKGWVGSSDAYRKVEGLERDPTCRTWIENTLFERIAHKVLGRDVALYRAVLWNKAPNAGTELPWHQDDGNFWGIDRAPVLQIWTALDDAGLSAGCLKVLPGTHLGGLASPEGGTVQAERLAVHNADKNALNLPVKAGESILLHNHLWHRSSINLTSTPRRAICISYLHGATRCTRKRRAPREFVRLFQHC